MGKIGMLLLAGLFLSGCFNNVPEPAEMTQDAEKTKKVYSLKDFLDSVYVLDLKDGKNQLNAAATLIGKENLIEIPVENWIVETDNNDEEGCIFSVELYRRRDLKFCNKQKTKVYKVQDCSIIAPPNGFRISSRSIKEKRYCDGLNYWQRKLITAFLDGSPAAM